MTLQPHFAMLPRMGLSRLAGYLGIAILAVLPWPFVLNGALSGTAPPFATFAFGILALVALLRPVWLVIQRHPSPTRQVVAELRANLTYLLSVVFILVALAVTIDGATQLKKQIPQVVPFYADPFLADLDRALFFGTDPWRLTHAVFGPLATVAIDALYAFWLIAQIILCMWIALSRDRSFQIRSALTFQMAWLLLGAGLATAFASVGPCFYFEFYGDERFLPMMASLKEAGDLGAFHGMRYLLETQGTNGIGGGISAMPSLHVGISVLMALCIREKFPKWQWVGWSYLAAMYVGSVHLGWHYATDGLVSAAFVLWFWKVAGYLSDWPITPNKALSPRPSM